MQKIRWTDRVRSGKNITQSQGGRKHPTHAMERWKTNWLGHILRRKFLLKQAVEGRIEMTGRRVRKRKQLLADRKETTGY